MKSTRSLPRTRLAALGATLVATLVAAGCAGPAGADADADAAAKGEYPETLVLGAIPGENSTSLAAGFDPIVTMLEEETGSTVEVAQASDYAGVIEGLNAGTVDVAFLGSFAYVIGVENGVGITPLGAVTETEDADPGYYSLGITQGDNDAIDDLADFAGQDVCFVDPGSTSGFLYPSAGLIESGVIESGADGDLEQGVKPTYAGGHDASALAVASGDCEAGFAMQSMVERTLIDNGELEQGDLKEVWRSEKISGSVFVARDGLGEEVVADLTTLMTEKANADYLLEQGWCEGECLLTDEDAWGVKPAQDSDYDGVREVCRITKSPTCSEA